MSTDVIPFGPLDFVLFAAMLAVSASTGIYHCYAGGGQKSTSKYLVADRKIGCVPIALSIFVSFTSAVAILGFPAEIFVHGIQYINFITKFLWAYPFAAYFFIPVFRSLNIISVYEYIGLRYHPTMQTTCALIFVLERLIYMATTMVGPALAVEAVQGYEVWHTLFFAGAIATFYTTLGGMKAVIWADVFQFFVMFGSVFAVTVLGLIAVGGIDNVLDNNNVENRLKLFDFTLDPMTRLSFFGLFFGSGIGTLGITLGQTNVQRYITAKSLAHARGSLLLSGVILFVMFPIMYFNGLVLYAFYNNQQTSLLPAINSTDWTPFTDSSNGVPVRYEPNYNSADQILMYFVSNQFGRIPGMQGLFVSCLFAGALSSVSSGINSVVACMLQDVIKPWRRWRLEKTKNKATQNDAWDTKLTKILNCIVGIVATLFGFLVPYLGTFVEITNITAGVFGGPLTGVFIMAMFIPRTNTLGTSIGLVIGFSFGVFMSAGPVVARQLDTQPLAIHKTQESEEKRFESRRHKIINDVTRRQG
ncbi:sodium-coupled monocarboxylate transporter 1-like isoform X2 [Ptychodera flava]|uniref:sodium-coupled monocarboxylate transporter 1-like isoform X2 n=1 Tax=Ptychodera flava TaxID=63121 RepID=UPI00396A90F9